MKKTASRQPSPQPDWEESAGTRHRVYLSYADADTAWADWIAALLASVGCEVVRRTDGFAQHPAEKDIDTFLALGSRAYGESKYCLREWQSAMANQKRGLEVFVLLVGEWSSPLLDKVFFHRLFDADEEKARALILRAVRRGGASLSPSAASGLPGKFRFPGQPTRVPSGPPPVPPEFRKLVDSPVDLLQLLARIGFRDLSARTALERPETLSRQTIAPLAALTDPAALVALDQKLAAETHSFRPHPLWIAWFEQLHGGALARLRAELETLAQPPANA